MSHTRVNAIRGARGGVAFVAIATLLTGSMALGVSQAAEPAVSAATPTLTDDEAVAALWLERDQNIGHAEAVARLARQHEIGLLTRDIDAAAPSQFAGAYVDQAAGGLLVVGLTADVDLAELVHAHGLDGHVAIRRAAHTHHDLVSLQDRLMSLARASQGGGSVASHLDVAHNQIVLEVPPEVQPAGALGPLLSAAQAEGSAVRLERRVVKPHTTAGCDAYSCPPPVRAGTETDWTADDGGNFLCSTAFIARDNYNAHNVVLSAGHCHTNASTYTSPGAGHTYQAGAVYGSMVRYGFGGTLDAEVIDLSRGVGAGSYNQSDNYLYQRQTYGLIDPNGYTSPNDQFLITRVATNSEFVQGNYVCKSARSSGLTCGPIVDTNASATVDGQATNGFFGYRACTMGGDSGGPVYDPSAHEAMGIVSYVNQSDTSYCDDNTTSYAPKIQDVTAGLNVSVVTSGSVPIVL